MFYRWTEISTIPQKPGVYAWYFEPEITDYDLENTIEKIVRLKENRDSQLAKNNIKEFLSNFIFKYFKEEPYQASLKGLLKPQYQGYLEHNPILSESLIERILEDPERLITIKKVLETSAPNFSSPIYIGMSENLRKRLRRHKKLIEKYHSEIELDKIKLEDLKSKNQVDQCFAFEICKRSIPTSRLFVSINILDENEKKYVDIENILNRIHYPLFGRN